VAALIAAWIALVMGVIIIIGLPVRILEGLSEGWFELGAPACASDSSTTGRALTSNALDSARQCDTLVVTKLDRLPRSARHLKDVFGQASFSTTEKHYIMAQSRLAGHALASAISKIRRYEGEAVHASSVGIIFCSKPAAAASSPN
jgi:hypothetical protein